MSDKIQCIVTDLDFTLLNSRRELNPADVEELLRLRQAGIPFTFVTGRHFMFARKFVRITGLDIPFSSSNGALIYDPKAKQPLKINAIEPDTCAKVIEYAVSLGIPMSIHTDTGIYATEGNPRVAVFEEFNRHLDDPSDYFMPQVLPQKGFAYKNVFKISAYNHEGQDVLQVLGPMLAEAGLQTEYSESCLLDVTTKDSTKGDGIRDLSHFIGFDLAHTIAFGDNHNDLSLLQAVGHPVAVGNAVPAVKAAAEYVTLTCDEAGVSHALKNRYSQLLA